MDIIKEEEEAEQKSGGEVDEGELSDEQEGKELPVESVELEEARLIPSGSYESENDDDDYDDDDSVSKEQEP